MWIENVKDRTCVLCTPVSKEPGLQKDLQAIKQIVDSRDDCYVIISLANVNIDTLTSSIISQLLELHNWLSKQGRILILCKVGLPVRGIFRTVGLSSVFNLTADIFAAKAMIHNAGRPELQRAAH